MNDQNRKSEELVTRLLLDVIEFQDKDIFYAVTRSLNLLGYGRSKAEALASWRVVVENYLTYTQGHDTLVEDLSSCGFALQ